MNPRVEASSHVLSTHPARLEAILDSLTPGQDDAGGTSERDEGLESVSIVARTTGILSIIAIMFLGGTSVAAATPRQADAARVASAQKIQAEGSFEAMVFFNTLVPRPVGTSKCEFMVQGRLIFNGTLDGVAEGSTTALIDAPCAEALDPNNLGAFRDVFRFEGTFTGQAAGVDASGALTYAGVTRPGGSIDANINIRADRAKATLRTVNAQLGVGGTYRGVAVTKN